MLATAGDLVFQGTTWGELRAYDAATGALAWQADTGTGIIAPPVSYELDGEQYIAVVAGLVLPRSTGQSTNEREVESKLLALERLVRVQAFSAKDVATVDAFLADECAFVTLEGRSENKAEFLRDLQSVDMVRYVVEQMIVRVHGDTAVVTGLLQMSGVQHGKLLSHEIVDYMHCMAQHHSAKAPADAWRQLRTLHSSSRAADCSKSSP